MKEKFIDLAVLLVSGGFYLINRLWLTQVTGGWPGWFLSCYANDIFAGAAMTAWTDLLLRWGKLPPVRSWRQTVPLLLACGFVWEVLAPICRPGAVFDVWDFPAYQAGGVLWLSIQRGSNS